MLDYVQPRLAADFQLPGQLQTLFQPVYSLSEQHILGYEALTRGPADSPLFNPLPLFAGARNAGQLCQLDQQCRQQACSRFVQLQLSGLLFLNVSPESLLDPAHQPGRTLKMLGALGLSPSQVVIELTELASGQDFALLEKALRHYRVMGFQIALDDLGAGFSCLRLWSELRPDYVKVDRHFISGIHQDAVKREFVNSILKMASASRAQVIVEGVEQPGELAELLGMGVDLVQGFLLCRPLEQPPLKADRPLSRLLAARASSHNAESPLAQLLLHQPGISQGMASSQVFERFQQQPGLNTLAVLDSHQRPLGIIRRHALLEAMRRPFADELLGRKAASQLMREDFLAVEQSQTLQQVSRLLTCRAGLRIEEDFVILKQGVYQGLGRLIDVLQLITGQQLQQTRHTNPLTLLPGNLPTQHYLASLLHEAKAAVICRVDIDHFKAFNELFGYARGDAVLICLARCLRECIDLSCDFVGHIAEDDFLLALRSPDWQARLNNLQMDFQRESRHFYRSDLPQHASVAALLQQQRGDEFPLLSLSLGVVTLGSGNDRQLDVTQLNALACEAVAQAKTIPGYSLHHIDATAGY